VNPAISCLIIVWVVEGTESIRESSQGAWGGVWGVRLVTFSKNNTKKSWLGYRVESRGRGML